MTKRTVRELGGEIWAEMTARSRQEDGPLRGLDVEAKNAVIDLIMGVLARYDGAVIVNDPDMQVTALPALPGEL